MKHFALCISAASLLLAAAATPGAAQLQTGLTPGARVRLITPRLEASQQTVTVVSSSSDSVHFRSQSHPVTRSLPLSQINAVEVRSYGERPFLRNMFIGGAVGTGVGAALAFLAYEECDNCWYPTSRGRDTAGGALLGGLAGVIGGLAVAAVQRRELWTRIPLNANVALLPSLNGRFYFNLARAF